MKYRPVVRASISALLVVIGTVCFGAIVYGADAQPGRKVLLLQQENSGFGPVSVYISPTAVKYIVHGLHFEFLASAPDWKVAIYSPSRKKMMVQSFDDWINHNWSGPSRLFRQLAVFDMSRIKREEITFKGLPCYHYRIAVGDTGVSMDNLDVLYGKNGSDGGERKYSDFICSRKPCARRVARFLSHLQRSPDVEYIPLVNNYVWTHRVTWSLKTDSWSETSVPNDFFKYPTTFAIVKTFEEVQYSKESQNDMEDAFRTLDLGDVRKERKH